MKDNIQLYIGGMPVDLSDNVDVLFTYAADDLTNPTVVRNSYSKTLSIEDTPENSKVFGQFWNVERAQSYEGEFGVSFNPSKRVPFTLYANGDIYESGYAKLTNVKKNGKNNLYELVLFGGLGSFLYNLSYLDDNSTNDNNKRKLSDLHFMTWDTNTPSENEFNFAIKKETIQDAWNNVQASESSKWHYINFADCYDGVPSDFDTDKVLMYMGTSAATASTDSTPTKPVRRPGGGSQGTSIPTSSSTTEGDYATFDGYTVAQLPKDKTSAQMREFRSYLMRPVLRVKEVINACCASENNGGYEVELDPTFFNVNNPYWENAWMTLPLLSTMDFEGVEGDEQTGVTATVGATVTGGTKTGTAYTETTSIILGEISASSSFNFSMDLNIQAIMNSLPSGYVTADTTYVRDHSVTGGMYMSPSGIYPCAYSEQSGTRYPGTICVQLVAYSRDGKVIAGSDVYNCTSGYNPQRTSTAGGRGRGSVTTSTYVPNPNDFHFDPEFEAGYITKNGGFKYVNGSTWQMYDTLTFNLKRLPKTCTLKLVISKLNGTSQNYSNKAMCLFQRYYGNYTTDSQGYLNSSYSTFYRSPATVNHFNLVVSNVEVSLKSEEGIRTGAKFTKGDLLNTDYTPADFFLSYMKLFGMYITKDKYEDVIRVMTRSTFYRQENVIDLSKKIDRSKDIDITPIMFDSKWYNWRLEYGESEFAEDYEHTYGVPYEIQRVNTGYNFDASEKDLYKDTIFKGGIECLEKSDMFGYVSGDTKNKPWMYDGFKYNLYSTEDLSDTLEININPMTKKGVIRSYSDNAQYDLYTKLQLHGDDNNAADGGNILVFFDGLVPTKTLNTDETLNYWITDDNSYMSTLNDGNPCWLYTTSEQDSGGDSIALKVTDIPHFTRYIANPTNGRIMQSWGFGVPKQLYIPGYTTDYSTTLYDNYWRSYIKDMYDVDTKKLSCYVRLDERPTEEWLRDFYWFDNSLWRINRINEANVKNVETTNVEFVKVQDMANYSNVDVSSIPAITITPSTTAVTNNGATVTIYVNVSDGGDWFVSDYVVDVYNASVSSGHGNGSFTITIPRNEGTERIVHRIAVENGYDQWGWCEVVQGDVVLRVEHTNVYVHQDVPWTGNTSSPCLFKVWSTYPWTGTDDRSYASFTPTSGQGDPVNGETFELVFDPSDSLAPRNVKITITDSLGNTVDTWKWQQACGGIIFAASGETKTVDFISGYSGTTPEWITMVDNGDDTYNITAAPNPGLDPRTVTMFLTSVTGNSQLLQVFQYAGPVFNVERTDGTGSVLSTGGSITLEVTANGEWSITNHSNWCTPSITSGTTSATITVTVAQNEDEARRGTIIFQHSGGPTIYYEVTQNGINTDNFVDPTALIFDASGGTKTFDINTTDEWQIVGRPSWTSVSSTGGTGSTTISVTVPESFDWERSGSIVVWNRTKNKTYVVAVQQSSGDVFKVARVNGSGDIPAQGGPNNICYLEVTSPNHSWTATTTDNFITFTPTGHTASTGVYVTFTENAGPTRTATITFNNGLTAITYTQTQAGYNQGGLVQPNVLIFDATGGTQQVTVSIPNNWQVVGRPNWVTTNPSSGSGVTTVDVYAIPYSSTVQRQGSLVVADMTTNQASVVTCIQNAGEGEILAVSPSRMVFGSEGGTAQLTIIANTDWTIG